MGTRRVGLPWKNVLIYTFRSLGPISRLLTNMTRLTVLSFVRALVLTFHIDTDFKDKRIRGSETELVGLNS